MPGGVRRPRLEKREPEAAGPMRRLARLRRPPPEKLLEVRARRRLRRKRVAPRPLLSGRAHCGGRCSYRASVAYPRVGTRGRVVTGAKKNLHARTWAIPGQRMRHLKRSSSSACWGLLVACAAAVSALDLTTENFGELTAGKAVFLKFYAPWQALLVAGDFSNSLLSESHSRVCS